MCLERLERKVQKVAVAPNSHDISDIDMNEILASRKLKCSKSHGACKACQKLAWAKKFYCGKLGDESCGPHYGRQCGDCSGFTSAESNMPPIAGICTLSTCGLFGESTVACESFFGDSIYNWFIHFLHSTLTCYTDEDLLASKENCVYYFNRAGVTVALGSQSSTYAFPTRYCGTYIRLYNGVRGRCTDKIGLGASSYPILT